MDARNRFHTESSWTLARAEQLGLLFCCVVLALTHLGDMRWALFALAFASIDLVGYLPGALAQRRAGEAPISPVYHHLYNLTHSYLTALVAIGLWTLLAGDLEPAMLALPIHLAGDRGLFGNAFKPVELPFEPRPVDPLPLLRPEAA